MDKRKLLVGCLGAAFFGWYFASPWLVLHDMRRAAERHDAAALSAHVDFAALRASAKRALDAKIGRRLAKSADAHGFGLLAGVLVSAVARHAIDELATPAGVAQLLASSAAAKNPAAQRAPVSPELSFEYDGFDVFLIHATLAGQRQGAITLVMQRRGIADWKLVGVRL